MYFVIVVLLLILHYFYVKISLIYQSINIYLIINSCKEEMYSLKAFAKFISSSVPLRSSIDSIRSSFVTYILSPRVYVKIIKRQSFFYENPNQIHTPPNENFCENLFRILFTNEPSTYHFDFISPIPSINAKDNLILQLKQLRGYGSRKQSEKQKKYTSFKSLHGKSFGKISSLSFSMCSDRIKTSSRNRILPSVR